MSTQICKRYFKNRKVLFITTKNLDYIRNVQEINAIREVAEKCVVIGSYSKLYLVRLLTVFFCVFFTKSNQFDSVFIGFAPQLVIPFFSRKWRKNSVVIDFFISLYDTLCFDRKKLKPGSVGGRLLHRLDKMTLEYADVVVCDTNAHGQYFAEEFHISEKKFYTWYLHADTSIYYSMKIMKPKEIKDKYVVLYFGSVLSLQGVDVVLRAMELLKEEKRLHFFFIGPIKDKALIKIKPVSDNITYVEWLPQEKLAEYIAMSDLCLAGHFNDSVQKAARTIPGKAYIYQAMGKKMILGENPANREVFEEGEKILFVRMGDEKTLAEKILEALKAEK